MSRRSDAFHASVLGLCWIIIAAAGAQASDEAEVEPLTSYPADYYSFYAPSSNREADLERLYDYLAGVLRDEEGGGGGAEENGLVYEEGVGSDGNEEWESDPGTSWGTSATPEAVGPWVGKRAARYSGRYTWKRRSGNSIAGGRVTSDSRGRYLCNPTREDIFQLLVALHEAREGNSRRIVNFCNRKRPASAIYTNIRFLGKRRK